MKDVRDPEIEAVAREVHADVEAAVEEARVEGAQLNEQSRLRAQAARRLMR